MTPRWGWSPAIQNTGTTSSGFALFCSLNGLSGARILAPHTQRCYALAITFCYRFPKTAVLPNVSPRAFQTWTRSSAFSIETTLGALKELNRNPLGVSDNPIPSEPAVLFPVLEVESEWGWAGDTLGMWELWGEKSGAWFLGPCLADRPQCLISAADVLC